LGQCSTPPEAGYDWNFNLVCEPVIGPWATEINGLSGRTQ